MSDRLCALHDSIAAKEVLLHGLSIDALLSVISDDRFDVGYKADDLEMGISLTRSFKIAAEHASSQEDHFDTVLQGYYGRDPDPFTPRLGAVIVLARARLHDLRIEEVDYFGDGLFNEQEERVIGEFGSVRERIVGIACAAEELDWFEHTVIPAIEEFEPLDTDVSGALAFVRNRAIVVAAPASPDWLKAASA